MIVWLDQTHAVLYSQNGRCVILPRGTTFGLSLWKIKGGLCSLQHFVVATTHTGCLRVWREQKVGMLICERLPTRIEMMAVLSLLRLTLKKRYAKAWTLDWCGRNSIAILMQQQQEQCSHDRLTD